jgi:hypothetical protein
MSNHIQIIAGSTLPLALRLVDQDGRPLRAHRLRGASAELDVRVHPTDVTNVLQFTTAGTPMSLAFADDRPALLINFAPGDTSGLTVQGYFYQVVVTLADGTVDVVVPWDLFDVTLGGASETPPAPFPSTVTINQDYPLAGDMLYQTPGGCGIEGAQVRVYLKSDYDAGNLASPVGIATTVRGGKWSNPVLVIPGYTYTAVFLLAGSYGPDAVSFFA